MNISEKGLNLLKEFEGLRLTAYQCQAGVWTIGYGHTKGVKKGDKITEKEAEEYLIKDIANVQKELNKYMLPINQNQYDALVSFFFNVGSARIPSFIPFIRSSGTADETAKMAKYIFAGKIKSKGLQNRRNKELSLYLTV